MLQLHSLLESQLIELFVVVEFSLVLWFGFSLEVHEGSGILNIFKLLSFVSHVSVSELVENMLIQLLRVVNLLLSVVLKVLVCPSNSWLVCLVLLWVHGHDFLDSLLDDCSFESLHAENEFKEISQFILWVSKDIFKSEEINHLICLLSLGDPVLKPFLVGR